MAVKCASVLSASPSAKKEVPFFMIFGYTTLLYRNPIQPSCNQTGKSHRSNPLPRGKNRGKNKSKRLKSRCICFFGTLQIILLCRKQTHQKCTLMCKSYRCNPLPRSQNRRKRARPRLRNPSLSRYFLYTLTFQCSFPFMPPQDYIDLDFEMGDVLTQQSEQAKIETKVICVTFWLFASFTFLLQPWVPPPKRVLKFNHSDNEAAVSSNTAIAQAYATYHAPPAAEDAVVAQDLTNVPDLLQTAALNPSVSVCPACGVAAPPTKDCLELQPLECSQCRLVWHLHCARLSRPPRFAFTWVCKACMMAVE